MSPSLHVFIHAIFTAIRLARYTVIAATYRKRKTRVKTILKRNNISLILIAALFGGLASGCATMEFGQNFDPVEFDTWVNRGQTTRAQIQEKLGEPTSKGKIVQENGQVYSRWLYYYGKGKVNQMEDATFKMLEVRFDDANKVAGYNWSADN